MKISVVIPVYNEEKCIKSCLDSLIAQDEKPDEIIVVNNNCIDNTINVVKIYKEVKIIQETKQGMISARNAGFNYAKGDIIAKCDADTIVPRDWINKIKKNFEIESNVAVTGSALFTDSPFCSLATHIHSFIFFFLTKFFLGHFPIYGPNCSIRKKYWEIIKDFVCLNDKDVHEDIDLSIHLNPYGNIIYDRSLLVSIPIYRLIRSPHYLIDYPWRWIKTLIISHKKA